MHHTSLPRALGINKTLISMSIHSHPSHSSHWHPIVQTSKNTQPLDLSIELHIFISNLILFYVSVFLCPAQITTTVSLFVKEYGFVLGYENEPPHFPCVMTHWYYKKTPWTEDSIDVSWLKCVSSHFQTIFSYHSSRQNAKFSFTYLLDIFYLLPIFFYVVNVGEISKP